MRDRIAGGADGPLHDSAHGNRTSGDGVRSGLSFLEQRLDVPRGSKV